MTPQNGRLVVVSNRVASPNPDGTMPAGGLAVALRDALRTRGGLWFGWSGEVAEAPQAKPRLILRGRDAFALIDLTEEQRDRYYTGFANRTLWPLMHYRLGLTEFSREDYAGYLSVNERFAEALLPLLAPDDLVWIHDYHLIPLAKMLRRHGFAGRIGYFHHIPWPPPEVFGALPCGQNLLAAVMEFDLVGLQTTVDTRNLLGCLGELPGAVVSEGQVASEGLVERNGAMVRVAAFPIGIDAAAFRRLAEKSAAADLPAVRAVTPRAAPARFVIGVDRLDYSKGIVPRLLAFEQFLQQYPGRRRAVSLLQIAPPTRSDLPDYIELDRQTDETAGRINAALAEVDWTPVRVIKKTYSRHVLAGLQRRSAVGFVTPMRDGMNLVAKEYVAAQDPADPGVLILSRFAGAARQLSAALIINPFDLTEMVEALEAALEMPLAERQERHGALLKNVMGEDASWWRDRYLKALEETTRAPLLLRQHGFA